VTELHDALERWAYEKAVVTGTSGSSAVGSLGSTADLYVAVLTPSLMGPGTEA
jgi:hypothetical protein